SLFDTDPPGCSCQTAGHGLYLPALCPPTPYSPLLYAAAPRSISRWFPSSGAGTDQQFLGGLNHLLAGVLSQIPDVRLRLGRLEEVCQPVVGLLLGHAPGFIELIELPVGLSPQGPQLPV